MNNLVQNFTCELPNLDLANIKVFKSSLTSYQFNRLDHSLQTASFEESDGVDIEFIFASLIHDVGDALAPENHSQMSEKIIQPFSLDEVKWFL